MIHDIVYYGPSQKSWTEKIKGNPIFVGEFQSKHSITSRNEGPQYKNIHSRGNHKRITPTKNPDQMLKNNEDSLSMKKLQSKS